MIKEIEIVLAPDEINEQEVIDNKILAQLSPDELPLKAAVLLRKSIDGRSKVPLFKLRYCLFTKDDVPQAEQPLNYKPVTSNKKVIVVGGGPAGMYAALRLIEHNIQPILLERGKPVRERRRDLKAIQQDSIVNPESNYCFGEGGAGTFSDGKLYTRSNKRGNVKKALQVLVHHGALPDIMVEAHPHIGSNKLPEIITAIRETITNCGGIYKFDSKVTDFIIDNNAIKGVVVNGTEEIFADGVVLATGHSARDIYELLKNKGITLEAKKFAMGVRVEHPQALINELRYHSKTPHYILPAASYELACQIQDHGVFSFCMCPGGIIIPAATAPNELVLNGMSVSKRNSPFANSGLVVSVEEQDLHPYKQHGIFAGLEYQKDVERMAFAASGSNSQKAPAQRVVDFVNRRTSVNLPDTSYIPGIVSTPVHEILPKPMVESLRKGLVQFNNKMRGFMTNEAIVVAAETRTSSPLRIPRDKETLMHVQIEGLFPSGEGAGYAGGIISAAMDGENCADAVTKWIATK